MTKTTPLRVLRISHSATLSAYRDRERALHARGDMEIALCVPKQWHHLGEDKSKHEPICEPFSSLSVRTFATGSIPLFAFDPFPIIKMLQQFKPDIVDIHEEPYSVSCYETLLLSLKYAPQASLVFYAAQNVKKNYPPPFCWTEQFVYHNSQCAYPCSTSVRDVLLAKGFTKYCPIIPLGVNPKIFSANVMPMSLPFEPQDFVIGYTGRLEVCKGIEYLIKAAAHLKSQHRLKLLIAGGGRNESSLRNLAHELGLTDKITWLGELAAEQMPAFYRSCNVIVVPSITTASWREQFGRVPVEAMACGTPVIVSDSGSLPEVVAETGLIVKEQDDQSLAEALQRLSLDQSLRVRLTAGGLRCVEQKYTWEKVADSMHSLYLAARDQKSGIKRQAAQSLIPR